MYGLELEATLALRQQTLEEALEAKLEVNKVLLGCLNTQTVARTVGGLADLAAVTVEATVMVEATLEAIPDSR